MKNHLYEILILIFCVVSFQLYAAEENSDLIMLSEQDDVQDAKTLNTAIDLLSNKVMECVDKKLASPQDCHCLYPEVLSDVRKVYDGVLDTNPDWRDKILFFWRDKNQDYSYNISLKGLRLQFEQKCE